VISNAKEAGLNIGPHVSRVQFVHPGLQP